MEFRTITEKRKKNDCGNLVLIGMPGVGKSTIGRRVADKLGLAFCDTDELLRDRFGMTLVQMLEQYGVDGFIARENELCASLSLKNTVIATGGSVVYGKEAMEHLRELGDVVYLSVSEQVNRRNLTDLPTRGVVMRPGQGYAELYRERTPLYEQYADMEVDCNGLTPEDGGSSADEIAQAIIRAISKP